MLRLTSVKGREGEEGEEEEGDYKSPGAVPSPQPEEVEGVQLLQADTVEKLPEEKQRTHCHRNAQALADFFAWAEPIVAAGVPTTVRGIYQRLSFIKDVSAEHRLDKTLQEMTLAQPHDVVVTLLRCAPSCDRVAVTMWMAIVSSNRTAEKVLPELLCVLEDWPLHSTSTSDKDNSDVFSLAATRAVWEIIHLPQGPERMILYFPRLFVALLFQVFSSTEQMPEEVNAFWRRCQHKHCLPTNPNRFVLLTMKSLLCHLEYENVVSEVERECGWDTLLNTDTHHYTVKLLARAMLRVSEPLCYRIARYLFRLLHREEAHWEVAAMAFLVEVLPCLNIKHWGERILQLFQIYLWREQRVMRLLVLRCLMVLCRTPCLANTMSALTESLVEVLKDEDREVRGMTLSVLSEMLLNRDVPIAGSLAVQLIEALRPLFDNDTSHVQLLSIRIFEAVMELVEEEGKEPLEKIVRQSLFPLFRHLHDKNQFVAEASWETLLQVNTFLQERKFEQLLETKWKGEEYLVPAILRDIYQWLSFIKDVSAEHRLDKTLQEMTLAQPHDVVVTLLRCAPSCDRVAVTMWMAIVSSNRTAEKVLPELLCVLEDWPLHSTSTSDKDNSDVFSLAATRAVWEIIHLPQGPERMILYFPRLFVALLFQVFSSTEQMPEEVNAFWRRCQHKHCRPTNPNRFVLLTMKSLLCHLEYENVVSEVERECGWDTLLNTDTHHYTVKLLARAMLRVSEPLCYRIARYLFRLLRREEAHWEVAAMAFLVEVLLYINLKNWEERILQLVQIYLQRECSVMRLLLLRCLMAESMENLTESLTDVLKDKDRKVLWMTLSVLSEMLLNRDVPIAGSLAVQLIEALRPLFDNDTSRVQLLSIRIFQAVMALVQKGKERQGLTDCVRQSLLPLFYHMYDENQFVAEASWETLLQATIFLKRWNLQQLLESEELWRFGECLLKEERDRADGYLRQSVMYLQSPQKSIREAAMRLTAPRGKTNKFSPSIFNLVTQTRHFVRTAETNPSSRFRLLQNQLREAWRRQASLLENGWPSLWHKVGFRRWKPPHY
ncbi:maestro heat-like repeat-containing protein family member 7 isoform X2 [Oenanthe melanoleuca]|uniref:maestro heat-like repeat-containing protein family member 7 isoform X2 n=1 Tax=Oenanthe melanoleuca TaxID=2939378 RepID=UPI0024C1339D|nr:maestro heat-like repeat-containing protein family member 7 isoform X2 [Oenanthe melanoleuca]